MGDALQLGDLRKLEKTTLTRIGQISEFGALGDIQQLASRAANTINDRCGSVEVHLGFVLDIPLCRTATRELTQARVDIGALVKAADVHKNIIDHASYSLMICDSADPKTARVLRKLHFDYEPLSARHCGEAKPTLHMQVGGKLSRDHLAAGYAESSIEHFCPWFEKPRIPVPPMSIALLLNWLFLEFQQGKCQSILKNPTWCKLVADAERTLLRPYFAAAYAFLNSTAAVKKSFVKNHLYEMH